MKLELEAEKLTADQIIEAICKHPVIYKFKHECLRVMQDEAKEKIMTSEELLSREANKLATQMAEEKIEQERVDLTYSKEPGAATEHEVSTNEAVKERRNEVINYDEAQI